MLEIFFEDRSKFDKQNPILGDLCNPNPDPKVNDADIQRRLDNPRGGPPSSPQLHHMMILIYSNFLVVMLMKMMIDHFLLLLPLHASTT